ncbi:MAG: PAS domain S-box protein, partial [Nitriliruptorales bacterium]|nr:PAS domain S-box protein [Nitriliruptorales bacterium]
MAAATEPTPSPRTISSEALLAHSRDVIVVLDARGRIAYANPAVSTFGYEVGEVLGRPVEDFIPADYAAAMAARFEELRRSDVEIEPMVHRLKDAAGAWRWVEASHADRLRDPDIRGIVITLRDVTQRVTAERALRESEARFRRLAHNAPDIIFRVIPGESGFDYLSPAVETLTGYPPQAFYDDPDLARRLIHPGDVAAVDVAESEEGTVTVRVRHKDGSWRWVQRRIVHVRDDDGTLIAVEGISRDITETREAEAAYAAAQQRFGSVIETMSDAVLIFGASGQLDYVNPAAVELFGVGEEELLTRRFGDEAWDLRGPDGDIVPLEDRPVHRVLT